jgi:hypothetical protein
MAGGMAGINRETSVRRDDDAGAWVSLICLAVFAVVFIIYTTRYLPDPVATHFGGDNRANGWMSRNEYLLFMLAFMLGIPALVNFTINILARKFPQSINVPNRDYWLAPVRRDESLRYLSGHGKRLGCLIVMMMLGMHYVILKANAIKPPMLPGPTFSAVLFGFALALIWWIVRLYRRFPKPKD